MVRRSRRGHLEEKQKSEYLTVVQRLGTGPPMGGRHKVPRREKTVVWVRAVA